VGGIYPDRRNSLTAETTAKRRTNTQGSPWGCSSPMMWVNMIMAHPKFLASRHNHQSICGELCEDNPAWWL